MLRREKVVTFVATLDGGRARTFYEGLLGLQVISDDGFALALAVDEAGTMLRIQKVASFRPHPFTALGWQVKDIEGTVKELTGRGVVFERFDGLEQDDAGIWTAPSGTRVAWFKDPDGNVLSLSQG
jgi:catechol 2,3-dioxygenase-like lactoylglutathione lyase family enzyme